MGTPATRSRLEPSVFRLPVEKIRQGYYTDAYFNFTRELLEEQGRRPQVTMQVFQKRDAVLGGIDEAIAVLRECTGRFEPGGAWDCGFDELVVDALHEGDPVDAVRDGDDDRGRLLALRDTSRRSISAASRAARG